jgi:hypothetical protein
VVSTAGAEAELVWTGARFPLAGSSEASAGAVGGVLDTCAVDPVELFWQAVVTIVPATTTNNVNFVTLVIATPI